MPSLICWAYIRQIFRNENGKTNNSTEAGLNLQLRDFVPETATRRPESLDDQISISAATLYGYLKYAEEETRNFNEEIENSWTAKSKRKIKRRASTPAEELKKKDEQIFRKQEEKAAEKAENDDPSYKTSSTSEAESSGQGRLLSSLGSAGIY